MSIFGKPFSVADGGIISFHHQLTTCIAQKLKRWQVFWMITVINSMWLALASRKPVEKSMATWKWEVWRI